jgi:hypothetical protein
LVVCSSSLEFSGGVADNLGWIHIHSFIYG